MNKDADKLRKASSVFNEMADLYQEMADLYEADDTKENQEKITMLIGKLMIVISNMKELEIN